VLKGGDAIYILSQFELILTKEITMILSIMTHSLAFLAGGLLAASSARAYNAFAKGRDKIEETMD